MFRGLCLVKLTYVSVRARGFGSAFVGSTTDDRQRCNPATVSTRIHVGDGDERTQKHLSVRNQKYLHFQVRNLLNVFAKLEAPSELPQLCPSPVPRPRVGQSGSSDQVSEERWIWKPKETIRVESVHQSPTCRSGGKSRLSTLAERTMRLVSAVHWRGFILQLSPIPSSPSVEWSTNYFFNGVCMKTLEMSMKTTSSSMTTALMGVSRIENVNAVGA